MSYIGITSLSAALRRVRTILRDASGLAEYVRVRQEDPIATAVNLVWDLALGDTPGELFRVGLIESTDDGLARLLLSREPGVRWVGSFSFEADEVNR